MPSTTKLPHALYRAAQVRELDRVTIEDYGIPGATLMERAGQATFAALRSTWPKARNIAVVCGVGNNGGDGYVVARLARASGLNAQVLQLGDSTKLKGDALSMAQTWQKAGGEVVPFVSLSKNTEVIVDAVLGTGLERNLSGNWAKSLTEINRHRAPVVAVDIPSGLHSDTGQVLGTAVKADITVSFIGLKQGLFTGDGPEYCGEVRFDALQIPGRVYSGQLSSARRLDWVQQATRLTPRSRTAHKGAYGHVLVIGGECGFAGASRMAAEAAARSGAGLVSLATRPQNALAIPAQRPELMCHGVSKSLELAPLLGRATVIAIGPGLGQADWGNSLLAATLETDLPLVVDADALNILATQPQQRENWILTPHPGEAARLLGVSLQEIQADRFQAVTRLQKKFGGTALLKGAGSLVYGGDGRPVAVCSDGNPGMASGGMGDVLTGIIAGLLAQGFGLEDAACMGVCLHAAAADAAALQGERGLMAMDLLPHVRRLLNPK